jgi:hypothetical protein
MAERGIPALKDARGSWESSAIFMDSQGQTQPRLPTPSPKSPGHCQCVGTLETVKTDYHFATPLLATPGKALGESVDLIVVATGKSEQLSDEFL